jgi:hypothetical protein
VRKFPAARSRATMRTMWSILVALVVLAAGGCARQKIAGQCADSVSLRCATEKVCAPDSTRGCQVCQCAPPADMDRPGDPANPVLPPE